MMFHIKLALKGMCMGAADVVPGVSGGTMALILGIYEDLILAIRSFDLTFFKKLFSFQIKEALSGTSWRFLLPLGLGILFAIFTLAKGIGWALHNHPVLIWSFFFGLVLASILTVTKHIKTWTPVLVVTSLLSAVGAYFLVGLVPVATPNASWFIFLSGSIAICAMILPGISGSFILVLLGKYHYILEAVNQRDFLTLGIFSLGAGIGLILFSRLLGWLLERHHDLAIAILCGLMAGSLRKVWPWKSIDIAGADAHLESNIWPDQFGNEFFLAVGLAVFGFLLVIALDRLAAGAKRNDSK